MHEIVKRYKHGDRDFIGADLGRTYLRGANLREANLRGADLRWANLRDTILRGADLRCAILRGADLRCADLRGADLRCAILRGADLRCAILRGADLRCAILRGADLRNTDLSNTILDPSNVPNGDVDGFEKISCRNNTWWCVGYRSKESLYYSDTVYEVGQEYTAPVFSTSGDPCHPGLYVCSAADVARVWSEGGPIVRVIFRPEDCHHAGDKWRVKSFIVTEDFE